MGIRYVPNNYILLAVELTKNEYDVISNRGWIEKDYELYGDLPGDSYSGVENICYGKRAYFFYLNLYYEEIDNWVNYSITLTELTTKSLEMNSYLNYVFKDNLVRDVKLKVLTKHEE